MKNQFKTLAAGLLLTLALINVAAADNRYGESGFRRVVVFGDSLSDPGNYFAAFHEVSLRPFEPIPAAPYAIGGLHFSNGATWIEQLAGDLHAGYSAGAALRRPGIASNYAVGRARARPGAAEFSSYDLTTQVALFLAQFRNRAPSDALYVVWIGANDLKDALSSLYVDPSFATASGIVQGAVGTTAANMQALYAAGARRFLLVDMPNIGNTPFVIGLGPSAQFAAGQLTSIYNGALSQVADGLSVLPGISITSFDVNAALDNAMVAGSYEDIDDFTTPCLSFGIVEHAVCRRPDQHLFWDAIHPTRAGHDLIADAALDVLSAP